MNSTFRTFISTLSFLIVIGFAGLTTARADERLKIADFVSDPDSFAGRTVELEARVVAINANGQSLELFDSPSHTRISVQLSHLSKTERKKLLRSDVRHFLVRGRILIVAGQLTIHAESIDWNDKEPSNQK